MDDAAWTERWAKASFNPRPKNFRRSVKRLRRRTPGLVNCGTEEEPQSSLWLASLSEAFEERFAEGISVLDYGCGVGRYAQFLRQRLRRFAYYGLERPGSECQHGEKSVAAARKLFGRDNRVHFDLLGTALEREATASVGAVVMGSIFTHLDHTGVTRTLEKLAPVVARGGLIVFSIFLDDRHHLEDPGAYGFADCYARTWFTHDQLRHIARERGWVFQERDTFLAQDVNLYRIFAVSLA